MKTYYFDDSGDYGDHWRSRELASDEEALAWAERLKQRFGTQLGKTCVLYCEASETADATISNAHFPFHTIKEWKTL